MGAQAYTAQHMAAAGLPDWLAPYFGAVFVRMAPAEVARYWAGGNRATYPNLAEATVAASVMGAMHTLQRLYNAGMLSRPAAAEPTPGVQLRLFTEGPVEPEAPAIPSIGHLMRQPGALPTPPPATPAVAFTRVQLMAAVAEAYGNRLHHPHTRVRPSAVAKFYATRAGFQTRTCDQDLAPSRIERYRAPVYRGARAGEGRWAAALFVQNNPYPAFHPKPAA